MSLQNLPRYCGLFKRSLNGTWMEHWHVKPEKILIIRCERLSTYSMQACSEQLKSVHQSEEPCCCWIKMSNKNIYVVPSVDVNKLYFQKLCIAFIKCFFYDVPEQLKYIYILFFLYFFFVLSISQQNL